MHKYKRLHTPAARGGSSIRLKKDYTRARGYRIAREYTKIKKLSFFGTRAVACCVEFTVEKKKTKSSLGGKKALRNKRRGNWIVDELLRESPRSGRVARELLRKARISSGSRV